MEDTTDEFHGLRASYYTNLAAYEYLYTGSVSKAIDPASYSGYEAHMYNEEYAEKYPCKILTL